MNKHRATALAIAAVLGATIALLPTLAFADPTSDPTAITPTATCIYSGGSPVGLGCGKAPADTYYNSKIKQSGTFANGNTSWSPMGNDCPTQPYCDTISGGHFYPCGGQCVDRWMADVIYDSPSTFSKLAEQNRAGLDGNYFVCCTHGEETVDPGPFTTNDALQLNGGWEWTVNFNGFAGAWEWCGFFEPWDNNGAVIMTTGNVNSDGTVKNNTLYVAIGSVQNLVVAVRNTSGTSDAGVSINIGSGNFGTWDWMCVGYDGAGHVIVHPPNGGTQTFNGTPSDPDTDNVTTEGNLGVYGYGFWNTVNGGDHSYMEPTCALTNTCGTGGSSGGNGNTCAQIGPISGEPKTQWCPPNLACDTFDTGWNIGADILWLGCQIAQIFDNMAGIIVNAFIDMFLPSTPALESDWTGFIATMQAHVPSNYIYGALTALPNAFNGAHSTPSLDLTLPHPWNTTIHITWSEILSPFTPWRPLFAALVYVTFTIAVGVEGRKAFEN